MFEFKFISGKISIHAGIFSLIIALGGIATPIYLRMFKKFERTVEFTKDEIIYQAKYRTVRMKWADVASVRLFDNFSLSFSRMVYFTTRGVIPFGNKPRVTNKVIWSEYNDEMLEEIKQYWHGRIVNEDKYLKYKNRRDSKLKR